MCLKKLTLFVAAMMLFAFSANSFAQYYYNETCRNKTGVFSYYGDAPGYTAAFRISPDPVGEGWLRLTDDAQGRLGYVLIANSFPSNIPLSIEFNYASYNMGDVADGISVFLCDPSRTFTIGDPGGGLGYVNMQSAYLGIGLDDYGNFSSQLVPNDDAAPGRFVNTIAIRDHNWKYIAGTAAGLGIGFSHNCQATQPPDETVYYRRVRMTITPAGTSGMFVTVAIMTSPTGTYTTYLDNVFVSGTLPPDLQLGFAASTGYSTGWHQVRDVVIRTPGELSTSWKEPDECSNTVANTVLEKHVAYGLSPDLAGIAVRDTLPAGYVPSGLPTCSNGTITNYSLTEISGVRQVATYSLEVKANSEAVIIYSGSFTTAPADGTFTASTQLIPPAGFTDDKTADNSAVLHGKMRPTINAALTRNPSDRLTYLKRVRYDVTPTAIPAFADGSWAYLWTFEDGSTSTSPSPEFTYTSAGAKTATVQVTYSFTSNADTQCSTTASFTDTVTIATPTFGASITQSPVGTVIAGTNVNFGVIHSPPTGFTPSYRWTFPDGATPASATTPTATTIWYDAGIKTVTLDLSYTGNDGVTRYDTTLTKSLEVSVNIVDASTGKTASLYGVEDAGTAASPVNIYYSDTLIYSITAVNNSAINADVMVIDTLPAGLQAPFSISDGGFYNAATREIRWSSLTVPTGGGSKTLTVKTSPSAGEGAKGTTFVNRARMTYDKGSKIEISNATYHNARAMTVQFDCATGGSLKNGNPQTLDYKSYLLAGVQAEPDSGYTFSGWRRTAFIDRMGANIPATSGISDYTALQATGDFTLRAEFSLNEYAISYTLNGGDTVGLYNQLTYNVLSPTITLGAPVKTGYTFAGWTGSNGTTPQKTVVIPTGSYGNRSYTANFLQNRYKITYDTNHGTPAVGNPSTYTTDTADILLNAPLRRGYTFMHWSFVSSDGIAIPDGAIIPHGSHGDITATANWSLNTYTITYTPLWSAPPAIPNPTTYTIESGAITLNEPTYHLGYTFGGWDISSDEDGLFWKGASAIPDGAYGNLTATPVWSSVKYGISYYYEGGTGPSQPNITGYDTAELPDTIKHAPTRTGYVFDGWHITSDGGLNILNDSIIPQGTTGDITARAMWKAIDYTIMWNIGAGVSNPNAALTTYQIAASDIPLADASRTGYDFVGWDISSSEAGVGPFSHVHLIPAGCYGNLTISPAFHLKTYHIAYDYAGGNYTLPTTNPDTYSIESAEITLLPPSRTGYNFVNWTFTNADGLAIPDGATIPAGSHGDITAMARWTPIVYSIQYFDSDSVTPLSLSPTSYTVEDEFTLPTPAKQDKTFVGWTGSNGSVYEIYVAIPQGSTGDKTYIAHWSYSFSDNPIFGGSSDTIFRCNPYITLPSGGGGLSQRWILPDGTTSSASTIDAMLTGWYFLQTNYGSIVTTDSIFVLYAFDATWALHDETTQPPKVGYPQVFDVHINPLMKPFTALHWSTPDGTATYSGDSVTVIYRQPGLKRIELTVQMSNGTTVCSQNLTLEKEIFDLSRIFFVNSCADGTGKGSSWDDAYANLEDALSHATKGDFIWVAEGIYKPAKGNSFIIANDSIEIFGGFAGYETNLSERNFALHPTILEGNGNSVVQIVNVSRAVRINGITISDGSASEGGGIRLSNASPTMSNLIIKDNSAAYGGGIYTENGSAPLICNTEISGNLAVNGAGIYNNGSSPDLVNVTIGGNRATNAGGGMYNSSSNPNIVNTIIVGNLSRTSILNISSAPVYANSMIEGSGGSAKWESTVGIDNGRNIDGGTPYKTPGFTSEGKMQDGDYRLRSFSLPVNAGTRAPLSALWVRWDTPLDKVDRNAIVRGLPYDLSFGERIADDVVDMGAYESDNDIVIPSIFRQVIIPEVRGITTNPPAGRHLVMTHNDFIFTVKALKGCDLNGLKVETGIPIRDKDGIVITANHDGTKTVKILQVTEPLTLKISGFTGYSSNSGTDKIKVHSFGNTLFISSPQATQTRIFMLSGQLHSIRNISAGETAIPLPQGVYIVLIDERMWKIVMTP